jgi:outer membrane protein OmpA-like peptidoglycan-associated protein/tetratricopeptide (TPR) repeat protein
MQADSRSSRYPIVKKIVFTSLFLFLVCASSTLVAQIKRANNYFQNLEYVKAVPFYEKALKKKQDPVAAANLAFCYKYLHDYQNAEIWYAKAVSAPDTDPMNYFYYGQVLKNNNKPEAAKQQFEKYVQRAPDDKVGKKQLAFCADLKVLLGQTPMYSVRNVSQLNSGYADFSPVYYGKGIVFTSDRGKIDLLEGDNNRSTNNTFLSIYFAAFGSQNDDSMSFKSVKEFSSRLNNAYHNGPVSFSGDQKMIVFNRVDKQIRLSGKHFTNRAKIYFSIKTNEQFGDLIPFPYNSDAYSVAQPALSVDGKTLYFSSDMPGGYGGKDLYVSRRDGDTWTKPENLGPEINTEKDEVFPYIRKDNLLFFSSDGHGGIGGLDIFSASLSKRVWGDVVNQGAPLNSSTDDFGIVFNETDSRGYFTSDRSGGKGGDDIYSFLVTNKFIRVAGRIVLSQDAKESATNASVSLLTEDGTVVKIANTDKNGFFKFENLPNDKKYVVKLDENDPAFTGKTKAWLTDEQDKLIRVTLLNHSTKGPRFAFRNLPADANAPPELFTADDLISLAGNLLAGTNPAVPIANQKVILRNSKGEIMQTTTTNAFGAFAFKDLPPDQIYLVAMEANDTKLAINTKITITNKSGKELANSPLTAKGTFEFEILAADITTLRAMTVADADLRVDLKGMLLAGDGTKNALSNTTIHILNEKGEAVQTIKTDEKGNFQFENLPSDQNYFVSIGEGNDPALAKLDKILLTDRAGKVLRELRINKKGGFDFEILAGDQFKMGTVYVNDPWLKVLQLKEKSEKDNAVHKKDSISIIENIYYTLGDWNILPEAESILAKVVQVMKNDPELVMEVDSHTDSRASAEFNMTLSNKRAKTAVDYVVARGVAATRIKGVGFGESKLLNKCSDGVECTDEEHAKNRRTEFKITKNSGKVKK